MWKVSVSNPRQQDGDAKKTRGHQKRGNHEHTPHDFSWACALRRSGLRDVGSSAPSLLGSICTDGNKEPQHNNDLGSTF